MGWGLALWPGATEIKSADETRAYHPCSRLLACAEAVVANAGSNATEIFGLRRSEAAIIRHALCQRVRAKLGVPPSAREVLCRRF
jgi:hypothetical protein